MQFLEKVTKNNANNGVVADFFYRYFEVMPKWKFWVVEVNFIIITAQIWSLKQFLRATDTWTNEYRPDPWSSFWEPLAYEWMDADIWLLKQFLRMFVHFRSPLATWSLKQFLRATDTWMNGCTDLILEAVSENVCTLFRSPLA
jgi:hypothetical protein